MPNLTQRLYQETNNVKTRHYVETGAYMGDGIKSVLSNYPHIHSIELAEKWYQHNVDQFRTNSNVNMYLGDSKRVLPSVLETIKEPATIFLDAHYSGGTTALGEEEVPLLAELDILKDREYDDIIVIDDIRLVGKTGSCGTGDNHPVYPTMRYDWRAVTREGIRSRMKPGYIARLNHEGQYTDGAHDQLILVRQK